METRHRFAQLALSLGLALALLEGVGGGPAPATGAPAQVPALRASTGDEIQFAQSGAFCPALPPSAGNVIDVYPAQAGQLRSIVLNASAGDTILLHDGTYNLNGDYIWIRAPGLTLRSASGNREAVVIDGSYRTTEIVTIAASDVTVADLTLKRASTHPIHVTPDFVDTADITNALIYNVHIVDPGEQAIKINQNGNHYADSGEVACSHIELTDAGRPHVSGCYTGGVDGHQAWGWVIRDNVIEGFWCPSGLSEHAIHFWTGSRDTLVERNVLVDNARGVGFGLDRSGDGRVYPDDPCPGPGYVGHFDGIIRNNFIFASRSELFSSQSGFDCGICLAQACGTQVLHNTVASTQAPFSSIEWRFPNTSAGITNNLVTHNLRPRDDAVATLAGNLDQASLSLFVDGSSGDLHLASGATEAIDRGVSIAAGLCDEDIDGDPRPWGGGYDIGADEVYGIDLSSSYKTVNPREAGAGEVVTFTIVLRNTGTSGALNTTLSDAIPVQTTYVPASAHATSGMVTDGDGIGWTGTVPAGGSVTITFQVTVNAGVFIENAAVVTDWQGTQTVLMAWANAQQLYLPVVLRQ
jgi:uncharacterized repeat protein (TIGR01451 family)